MRKEERIEEAFEKLLAGQELPEELLELLSTEEKEQLHLAARLTAVQAPARDPQIVAEQRQSLQELAAKNKPGKPAVFENIKSSPARGLARGLAPFTTRLSRQALAFAAVLLLILAVGIIAAGRWFSPQTEVITSKNTLPAPTETGITAQPEPEPSDEFLDIDSILAEIDQEVCREALATRAEIEAHLAQGIDLAELETAVNELIAELGGCPQTLLLSEQITDRQH